jgi:hypothetical protein
MWVNDLMKKMSPKKFKVIVSSTDDPLYEGLPNVVIPRWQKMGFEVEYHHLSPTRCFVDPEKIPLSAQAQMIRVLAPSLNPHILYLTSDIDMLPLNKEYFEKACRLISNGNTLVNLSADAYPREGNFKRYPICYFIGKGSVFKTLLGDRTIESQMEQWWSRGKGWHTDEICFSQTVWKAFLNNEIRLKEVYRGWERPQFIAKRRIDRVCWNWNKDLLRNNFYIDAHLPRPIKDVDWWELL